MYTNSPDRNQYAAQANAARRQQQEANVDSRPYWMYVAIIDPSTRPEHAAMNGRVFRYDDPIWQTHYPPLGPGCRCRVRALTESQVKARNITVESSVGPPKAG